MDIEHFYSEQGDGELIVLLHGNGEDSTYFRGQINALAERFHVYALDTRGHGRTPRGEAPFTIRQFADDLLGFMDAHLIDKAHVLGFSDGANIAMVFAMRYPERVGKLILNGANLDARGIRRTTQIPIEIGYAIASRFADKSESAARNAEMLGLMVNDPNIAPEELSAITAKTLVIAGTHDMVKRNHTELIAESIPRSELALIEGDHFVANKRPEAFNEVILRFLNSSINPL